MQRIELRVIQKLKMSDPRPGSEWGLELLRSVVEEQFRSGAFRELIRSEVLLFSRAPTWTWFTSDIRWRLLSQCSSTFAV